MAEPSTFEIVPKDEAEALKVGYGLRGTMGPMVQALIDGETVKTPVGTQLTNSRTFDLRGKKLRTKKVSDTERIFWLEDMTNEDMVNGVNGDEAPVPTDLTDDEVPL